jgi:hypothetical protein
LARFHISFLPDRGVVSVSGVEAGKFLQSLVTNDVAILDTRAAIFAGLLTPQGKILFDFLIVRADGGYLLEAARESTAALVKRLLLYKLRARIDIADASSDFAVAAFWGGGQLNSPYPAPAFVDPRLPELGWRALLPASAKGDDLGEVVAPEVYHARRIRLGVPEGGKDYPFGETFPHEALLDQLAGISFTKGCYVGQEVVARMEHRASVRKRVVPVVAEEPLPAPGSEVRAGEASVGTLGSVAGGRGLALVRLDRAAEAIAAGLSLRAGAIPIRIELPPFARFALGACPATG